MRTLLLLLIGALVWWLGRLAGRSSSALTLRSRAKPSAAGPQTLVACAHCGTQQPRSEALFDAAGQPYCCTEHRDAGQRHTLKA